ncbi:hypothetical protein PT974_03357 [Cladobotryum mycophilum]|uniref:Uncharacterized protein n=1 Tax=Cladobotryum mycophilum TaxID=491253 RepID=A0ABR0SS79_9HYPO
MHFPPFRILHFHAPPGAERAHVLPPLQPSHVPLPPGQTMVMTPWQPRLSSSQPQPWTDKLSHADPVSGNHIERCASSQALGHI